MNLQANLVPSTPLTTERLRKLLDYDERTGVFTWRATGKRAGSICGREGNDYIYITINGISYLAHRLAWLYVKGAWPTMRLDHRNRDRLDNRIDNLREVTHQQNLRNTGSYKRQSNLPKGVHRNGKKFRALIRYQDRLRHLGQFDTAALASEFYELAAAMCFGEFASTSIKP